MTMGTSRGVLPRISVCVMAFLFITAAAGLHPATAQQWNEFYFHSGSGTHFYMDPSSVQRSGSIAHVKWTDSNLQGGVEKLVYLAEVNCGARTIQSLEVARYNAQSGAYIGTVDLRGRDTPHGAGPGTMAGYLLGRVC